MRVRMTALLAAAAVGLGLGACGDDDSSAGNEPAIPATASTPAPADDTTSTAASASGSKFDASSITVSKDTSKKPTITKPKGDPPSELVQRDIVVGKGAAVKAGDQLVVHYLGAHFTGKQFESSWDSGQTFAFVLGQGNVIQGWDQGVAGMKVGGRRLLVIPPDLAYGDTGSGDIKPGETLIFVVDLLNATPA